MTYNTKSLIQTCWDLGIDCIQRHEWLSIDHRSVAALVGAHPTADSAHQQHPVPASCEADGVPMSRCTLPLIQCIGASNPPTMAMMVATVSACMITGGCSLNSVFQPALQSRIALQPRLWDGTNHVACGGQSRPTDCQSAGLLRRTTHSVSALETYRHRCPIPTEELEAIATSAVDHPVTVSSKHRR
jgi:hypothetical protein